MKRGVLSWKQLPAKAPLHISITAWLALSYGQAPGWLWGVVGTFMGVLWLGFFYLLHEQQEIELDALSADKIKRMREGQSI